MHRPLKLPARFLLVLLGAVLIAAGMTSVSLADTNTDYHGTSNFKILEANSTRAYFTIDDDCGDTDENCTVVVRSPSAINDADNNGFEDDWRNFLQSCTNDDSSGENGRNRDFANCWDALLGDYIIEWPTINPDDHFDITPYCKRGDDVCAEELIVCYNANDCDGNSYGRQSWTQVGELWDEADSCLYDSDEDDVWECLDEALDDWLDDNMGNNDDYNDLEDEEEEVRGFTLEDYENDLDDVGRDWPSPRRSETAREQSQQQGASRPSTSIYQPVDTHGPGFRPTRDAYLTVNFTAYLETNSPYQVCNTTIGCITVATLSNTFRSHMQNLHVIIRDAGVLSCMGRAGWDVGNNHTIAFDDANLIACDVRIRTANQVCPAKNTGASGDLFAMWDNGLLRGLLPDSFAQSLRLQVDRARDRTPGCLCAAGFAENNFVITPENTVGPWDQSGGLRTESVCN